MRPSCWRASPGERRRARPSFGGPEDEGEVFFERVFHAPNGYPLHDLRDVQKKSFVLLEARLAPNEVVGVDAQVMRTGGLKGEFSVLFRLLDAGFRAEPFPWRGPPAGWPRYAMGLTSRMEPRTLEAGGAWRTLAVDDFGRFGLYERTRP